MDFLRQLDIADPSQFKDKPITVIGAGGIGAALVVALAKTGFEKITVFDFDTIEEHNLPNQLLPMLVGEDTTVGSFKVVELARLVWELTGVHINPVALRYTTQSLGEIVIAAVDTMAVRKAIWEQASQSMDTLLYMDGRMAATSMDLYTVDMMNEKAVNAYGGTLFSDDEADPTPCTAKATMFNSFIIAGHMTSLLVAYLNGWRYPYRLYYNTKAWEPLKLYADNL
jgi:hypothetical protein